MNKLIITAVVVAVVAGGVGFYGGMSYQRSKVPVRGQFAAGQGTFQAGQQRRGGAGNGNGFVGGQVLSKDDKSITVKLPTGGSSIVFYSPNTSIEKAASGSWDDITVGASVVVRGTQNSDGTYTAQSVQLSRQPVMMRPSPTASPAH